MMKAFPEGLSRSRLLTLLIVCGLLLVGWPLAGAMSASTPALSSGVSYLVGSQEADGSWRSSEVRRLQATSEALRALQSVGEASATRAAAANLLRLEPVEDTDDRARRLVALAGEGHDVAPLVSQLLADAHPTGGWGLTRRYVATPLDTALALEALASRRELGADVLGPALSALLSAQRADGSWPCVASGGTGADGTLLCTSQALLALAPYRDRFYLTPRLETAATSLRGQLNPDGSFGPAGRDQVMNTSLAALALAALPALEGEVPSITAFLQQQQQSDGSWREDPYTTALALRALHALSQVPFCGDGMANRSTEACDGLDVRGATCGGLGLGTGSVACTPTCTLDTSGCSGPPRCGDGVINQPTEACDGEDLGAGSCEALGLGPGTLACDGTCKFDTSQCTAPPRCGDGVINRPDETCDGEDLGGLTCGDAGYTGGTLSCNPDCTLNASACTGAPFCGDGTLNRPEEECDRTDLGGKTCDSLGLGGGTLTCTTTCKLQTAGCASSGATRPRAITLGPDSPVCAGQSQQVPVAIDFPAGSVIDKVDVFLLFDDTGSFAGTAPTVTQIFEQLVNQLQAELPEVSFSYGVGRFEDYGGPGSSFSGESTAGRPFTLNQPLITPEVPGFLDLIRSALGRRAPGSGGDGPESTLEALEQIATGSGFDGNGNGSTLDSGAAGLAQTQTVPGPSGDVPAFSSNVAPASGTLGGVGFRAGALHLVIQAGDVCSVAPFPAGEPVPTTLTGAGGATVPTSALRCSNTPGSLRYGFVSDSLSRTGNTVASAVAPRGAATVPETVAALNALGISVIGLAPSGVAIRNPIGPSTSPSVFMSAMALLTGATDSTGNPLVFNISGGAGPIRDAIVQAVTTAATRPRDISLAISGVPSGLSVGFTPPVVPGIGPGGTATFELTFTGEGGVPNGTFNVEFVDLLSNARLATLPVTVGCLPVPPVPVDNDGDGFPGEVDCDDDNVLVNPGAPEIPGNGVDDDCNAATPDEVPLSSAFCQLDADKLGYTATDLIRLASRLTNVTTELTLTGLTSDLEVRPSGVGSVLFTQHQSLSALPPGGRKEGTTTFSAQGGPPGEYTARLTVYSGSVAVALCSTTFRLESSAVTGAGLRGTLVLSPAVVNAGSPSDATYTVSHQGNAPLENLGLQVLLVDPDSGQRVGQLEDVASLTPGASYSATHPFATTGLAPKTYLAVLLASLAGTDVEQTLATANLTVLHEPPDCSRAVAAPSTVLWAPHHKLVDVSISGVTAPGGGEVTTTIVSIHQDEPTRGTGDGATCPDASGTGTSTARVRAERSGHEDGRVYHLQFVAEDGRGGTCTSSVKVCVPHDLGAGATCVDQGALFDSTVCR